MSELQMRVADVDRDRTAQQLQHAFTEGRLTRSELDERLSAALTARTYGDLLAVVSDLPGPAPQEETVHLDAANGHIRRSGDWEVPRRLRVTSKHGSVDLDFSQALVPHPVVDVEIDLKYGSACLTLPPGASANLDGFTSRWGSSGSDVAGRPQPGALHVRVSGSSKYGSLSVRYPRKRWFTQ
ncbi:DUF1707 SHOCT-like domain-containing protein [Nonomuraea typhae]|uniref:DUF1707 SHOCT-like domain-containing protein n=1 Tax=Nonomuraea typhae TaxID=2603600 RepID=UPI001FE36275|nr:DUF1707 domain-containing protein [Nonomuraea typhae]